MTFKRLLVALLGSMLLGGVLVALAPSSAQAATSYTHESRIMLQAQSAGVYRYGDYFYIKGQVQHSFQGVWKATNISGDSVTLYQQIAGQTAVTNLGTYYPDSAGNFSFYEKSVGNATYTLAYDGGDTYSYYSDSAGNKHYAADAQGSRYIKGHKDVHLSSDYANGAWYVTGDVSPNHGGKWVIVDRKNCRTCSWYKWKSVQAGSAGGYRVKVANPGSSGYVAYRTRVAAQSPRWATGYSDYKLELTY